MSAFDILLQWNKHFPSLVTKDIICITRPRRARQLLGWVIASSGLRSNNCCISFSSDCSFRLSCNNIEMCLYPKHPYKVGSTISPLYRWERSTRSQRFNSNWNDCIEIVGRQETNSSFHTRWMWSALHFYTSQICLGIRQDLFTNDLNKGVNSLVKNFQIIKCYLV